MKFNDLSIGIKYFNDLSIDIKYKRWTRMFDLSISVLSKEVWEKLDHGIDDITCYQIQTIINIPITRYLDQINEI